MNFHTYYNMHMQLFSRSPPLTYHEQGLSLDVGEGEVQIAHVPVLGVAVQHHRGDALRDAPVRNDRHTSLHTLKWA
jgi:hypothetical protein